MRFRPFFPVDRGAVHRPARRTGFPRPGRAPGPAIAGDGPLRVVTAVPPMPARWIAAALFAAGLAAAFLHLPEAGAPGFAPATDDSPASTAVAPTLHTLPAAAPQAGPASLARLADGRIAAAWLAGPDDDESAAGIWFATFDGDAWSPPQLAARRESTAAGTFAHMNKLGRPLLWAEGGWLHLWYESLTLGDWAGAAIVHSLSTDGGKTWSKAERLPVSPFGALGSGLGGPPLALADGGLALPLDHRLFGRGGEMLRLSATGRLIDKIRLAHPLGGSRPSVVALDGERGLAVAAGDAGQRTVLASADGGRQWSPLTDVDLAGAATAPALLRLADGKLLLAGNPAGQRGTLRLWLSADDGRSWSAGPTIEAAADGAAEFADPALLQARDGRIHLAYTWRRQQIRHRVFSESWLEAARP